MNPIVSDSNTHLSQSWRWTIWIPGDMFMEDSHSQLSLCDGFFSYKHAIGLHCWWIAAIVMVKSFYCPPKLLYLSQSSQWDHCAELPITLYHLDVNRRRNVKPFRLFSHSKLNERFSERFHWLMVMTQNQYNCFVITQKTICKHRLKVTNGLSWMTVC